MRVKVYKIKILYFLICIFILTTSASYSSECRDISILNIKDLEVMDTKMKNPNGILSTKGEYAIYIKTKKCKKWRIIPETSTNNLWDSNKDILLKFQNAVKDIALIEQSIRDNFNLGQRKKLLMEKAKDWEKSIEKYCDKSLFGCNNPDVNCITILGKTYCIWGNDNVTTSS